MFLMHNLYDNYGIVHSHLLINIFLCYYSLKSEINLSFLQRKNIYDAKIPFTERFKIFESNITEAMKNDKEHLSFDKIDLVINFSISLT